MMLWITLALAQQITVTIDEQLAAEAGLDPDQLKGDVSSMTDESFKMSGQEEFLRQMANASALVTKGMGVDYASNPQRFVVGGTFGTAVNGVGISFVRGKDVLPTGGYSVQLSGMAGLNLGFASGDDSFLRRIVLSVNGMALKGSSGPFDARFGNMGAHLQFKLVRPPHKGVVEWGGLDLTGGYELSRYYLELTQAVDVGQDPFRWAATGSATIEAMTTTIPIELSTNLRILAVTAFAGVGFDLRLAGRSGTAMSLGGPLFVKVNGEEVEMGTVEASMDFSGTPDAYAPRLFGGAQLNVLFFKVYGQLNVGLTDESFGGHLGVRVAI